MLTCLVVHHRPSTDSSLVRKMTFAGQEVDWKQVSLLYPGLGWSTVVVTPSSAGYQWQLNSYDEIMEALR